MKSKEKTIEEKYQKLTQIEHVKKRPNMYIGNIKNITEEQWVFDYIENKMVKKFVSFTPAFLKIFDEVLTNATDHASRDNTVSLIKVDFDETTGEISVWNNGTGIPVVIHKEHNIYVPELIFAHLLSGSNYDDNEQRIGAGLNGLGVKLVNLFSKKFIIETIDSDNSLKYIQEFTDGLENKSKPKVTKNSGKSYTKITFIPDYQKFSMKKLDKDTISLLSRRVYDCIACTNKNVSIFLNGEKLKGKGLVDYAKYFFDEESSDSPFFTDSITQKVGKNEFIWEYIIVPYSQFEQVSFVNGNSTYNGGKHVDHIMYQIVNKLKTLLETKKKLKDIKPAMIRERMFLFLRSTVANPQFNSQTKEYLTTQIKDFGCKIEVNDKFIDKLWKSQIIEDIVQYHKLKETMDIAKKTDGSKKNKVYIPKLEDALWAGTNKSDQCTLILTEGESAKTFAMWGRSIVGPEKYGVMSLKGKFLNLRDASATQLIGNEEINNIKQIIGLKQGKEYKDTSELRYGKVMMLTDADSVTGDTPCILKNKKTNEIIIKPISEINNGNDWEIDIFTGKEYNKCDDYLVWSDNDWTEIISVMRHKVNKPIYRVLTHTGCVDVTEDHSLLDKKGKEITVKDCKIKETELLHKKLNYILPEDNLYDIDEEYAWALGYFQADGSCSTDSKVKLKKKDGSYTISYNYHWSITCIDKEPLLKLQKIFYNNIDKYKEKRPEKICENQCEKCYKLFKNKKTFDRHVKNIQCDTEKKIEFRITERKCSKNSFSLNAGKDMKYELELYGNRKNICIMFRKMFYNSLREKKVPTEILNNSLKIQKAFIDGFYAGDGNKGNRTTDHFDGEYKTQLCGLFQILQNCGYKPSLNCSNTKLNVYSIHMSNKRGYWRPEHTVKKIIDVSNKYKDTYVYDFETKNHHFHGSIGNLIVHNTDGLICGPEKYPANNNTSSY
jgi:DNA gyrase/topoisomerase IV subunit B